MKTDGSRLSELSTWIVVLCALLTTILVVRRELVQDSAAAPTPTNAQADYVEGWQEAIAAGISLGSADAPVQIVEFADFQCPYCARFETAVRTIRDKYPQQVAFTFAHFPLSQHSLAESAARAAECAHTQGYFEGMRALLFEKQQAFGSIPWTDFAKQLEIPDVEQFDACVNDTQPVARVDEGRRLGEKMGVRGTPTIIVNGWRLPVTPSSVDLDKIVQNVLNGRPPVADIDL